MSTLSYPKLTRVLPRFTTHWEQAATRYPLLPPLLLHGEVSRADFTELCAEWPVVRRAVARWEQECKLASEALDLLLAQAVGRVVRFNQCVRGLYSDSPYVLRLAAVPAPKSGLRVLLNAIQETELCWTGLNNWLDAQDRSPLVMADGFGAEDFAALLEEAAVARWAESEAKVELAITRGERDLDFARLGKLITAYRTAILTWLPEGVPLAQTVPRYSPRSHKKVKPARENAELAGEKEAAAGQNADAALAA